jgi:hypothetical protein
MPDHKTCYGQMFPNVLPPVDTGVHSGKVFSFQIENIGLARGRRSVSVNEQTWDDCLRCPEFDHCYKLSMGILALQTAIREA